MKEQSITAECVRCPSNTRCDDTGSQVLHNHAVYLSLKPEPVLHATESHVGCYIGNSAGFPKDLLFDEAGRRSTDMSFNERERESSGREFKGHPPKGQEILGVRGSRHRGA